MVVLSISLVSLTVIIFVSVLSMVNMRNNILATNEHLGLTAASESQEALEKQAILQLTEVAKNKATISEERLSRIQRYAMLIAAECTSFYSDPLLHTTVENELPVRFSKDTVNVHLFIAEGIEKETIIEEIGLVSNMNRLLANICLHDAEIASAYIGTESGFAIKADSDPDVGLRTLDPRTRQWYQLALTSPAPVWTDVYDDVLGRGLMITCAVPFKDAQGNTRGVVGIDALLTTLNQSILDTKIGDSGYAFLLNESGDLIISPEIKEIDGKIIRENFLESENEMLRVITQKMIQGLSGFEQLEYQNREIFMVYAPLQNIPWSIATIIDVSEIMEPSVQSKNNIIAFATIALEEINRNIFTLSILFAIVSIASIVLTVLFSIVLSSRITKPLAYLIGQVSKASEGKFDISADVKTGDEIEELSNSFNHMSLELKKYIDRLAKEMAERERIQSEIAIAAEIQADLVPNRFPAFPDRKEFDIYALMRMAKEVGGDFYDFFLIGADKLAFIIADVSGKGIPAALFMMMAKTIIKNYIINGAEAGEIFYKTNNALCENNEKNMFITAFLGILDIKEQMLHFVNAGHNPPLLKREDAPYVWLDLDHGFVLGAMPDFKYPAQKIPFCQGDRIFCYTDGVIDAVNKENKMYESQRLISLLNANPKKDIKETLLAVKADIEKFSQGVEQADDITLLSLILEKEA